MEDHSKILRISLKCYNIDYESEKKEIKKVGKAFLVTF